VIKTEKQICENCKKECIKHAKGMCTTCYKKLVWKPKIVKCRRCERMLPNHAKGLCPGCYSTVFQLENNKSFFRKKRYGIDDELYNKITKKCLLCGFDKIVEIHHLDKNRRNSSEDNVIGLCPNHHGMLHNLKYREEIIDQLNEIFAKENRKTLDKTTLFHKNNPRV
jgi:hypothetical protein